MPTNAQAPDLYEDSGRDILKSDLRRFFTGLRKQSHHIYALLYGAPKSVFWIVLTNDDLTADEQTFSVPEFYAQVGKFHRRKDTFRVYFNAYFFRDEWDSCLPCWDSGDEPFNGEEKYEILGTTELSAEVFEKEWVHLFANLCRQQILANTPFRLDRETIRRYKFSREDVKLLREPAVRCNECLIAELRGPYNLLASIDCLHKAPKKKPACEPAAAPVKKERAPRKYPRRGISALTRKV